MKIRLLLGIIISLTILFVSYSIVRVPTFIIPDDYYLYPHKYEGEKLPLKYEYYFSTSFVKVVKCDVICPNERGFPFTLRHVSEHNEFIFENIIASIAIYSIIGMVLSAGLTYSFKKFMKSD